MQRVQDNEHKACITMNSIAESSIAAYPNETRWTSAYLLHDSVRPSNLKVISNAVADRVLFDTDTEQSRESGEVTASGVLIHMQDETFIARLDACGEVALTGGAFGTVGVLQRSGVG